MFQVFFEISFCGDSLKFDWIINLKTSFEETRI